MMTIAFEPLNKLSKVLNIYFSNFIYFVYFFFVYIYICKLINKSQRISIIFKKKSNKKKHQPELIDEYMASLDSDEEHGLQNIFI